MPPTPTDNQLDWLRSVVRSGFCHGCGTCAGVCPTGAIEMERLPDGTYVPSATPSRCSRCGLCEKVCPAVRYDPGDFEDLFPRHVNRNLLVGRYLDVWKGHASDETVRYQATSGGIATALLCHALGNDLIDAAIVVRMRPDAPLVPEAFVAETPDAVRGAMGSKYLPVPLNSLLARVIENPRRYAVVGLPCHVRGVRLAMRRIPKVRNSIQFVIGLVCAHTLQADGFRYMLGQLGVEESEVREVSARGTGWPGGITFHLAGGGRRFLARLHSLFADVHGSHLYTPRYCLHCADLASEVADVVLSDAWLPSVVKHDTIGTSLVMTRTERGRDLVALANAGGAVVLQPCPAASFIRSQRSMLYFKKRSLAARQRLSGVVPTDRTRLLKARVLDYLLAMYPLFNARFAASGVGKFILRLAPASVMRLGRALYKLSLFAASRDLTRSAATRQVLVTNQHTDNRGDQAALHGVLTGLRQLLPGYSAVVLSQSAETDPLAGKAPDVQCKGMLTRPSGGLRALLYVLLRGIGLRPRWLLRGTAGEIIRAYEDADLVISAPGGPYIGDLYAGHEHAHLFHIWLAQALGKPTVLYAPSVGPFEMKWRNPFRRALLSRMDAICVREEISRDHLTGLGIPAERVEVVPDAALNYPVERFGGDLRDVLGEGFTPRPVTVGFTPCQWRYPGDPDPAARQKEYVRTLAAVLDRCVEHFDANIVAFPQLFGRHTDLPFIEEVRAAMKHAEHAYIFPPDRDCTAQQEAIGCTDVFLATRYHSQIFAAKMGVPSVCIAYEHKARGFMRLLGLEEYVLDIETVDETVLWQAVQEVWDQREAIRGKLAERIPNLAEAARRASRLCVWALLSAPPR